MYLMSANVRDLSYYRGQIQLCFSLYQTKVKTLFKHD